MTIKLKSNIQAKPYVANREAFDAGNIFAEQDEKAYVVYSYGRHFPLFVWSAGVWYANKDARKVSATTRGQYHKLKPVSDDEFVLKNTEELKTIIARSV